MRLTLANHPISDIQFGDATRLDETVLRVTLDELKQHLLEDQRLQRIEVEIV